MGVIVLHRQTLVFGSHGIFAAHTYGKFSLRQPIGHLAEILGVGDIHAAEKFLHVLRTDLGTVIKKLHRRAQPGVSWIERDDFSFLLGIDDVPIGFELFRVDQIGVVRQLRVAWTGKKSEDIFAFRIGVAVFVPVPFGCVHDLGKNERGFNRIE